MATFYKVDRFTEDLGNAVHNFSSHSLKVLLTNTAMTSSVGLRASLTEVSSGNGYTTGGNAATLTSWGQSPAGTGKLILADPSTWTASGGSIGPFQYAVLYNDTPTSPADPIIGYWDYGSAVTLAAGETFTVDFDATNGVLTVA